MQCEESCLIKCEASEIVMWLPALFYNEVPTKKLGKEEFVACRVSETFLPGVVLTGCFS